MPRCGIFRSPAGNTLRPRKGLVSLWKQLFPTFAKNPSAAPRKRELVTTFHVDPADGPALWRRAPGACQLTWDGCEDRRTGWSRRRRYGESRRDQCAVDQLHWKSWVEFCAKKFASSGGYLRRSFLKKSQILGFGKFWNAQRNLLMLFDVYWIRPASAAIPPCRPNQIFCGVPLNAGLASACTEQQKAVVDACASQLADTVWILRSLAAARTRLYRGLFPVGPAPA